MIILKKIQYLLVLHAGILTKKDKNYTSLFTHYFRKFLQNWFFKKGLVGFYMYNPVIFSSVMIKTEIMKKYMLNEKSEFVGIIDYELWLRLFKDSNKNTIFINKDLVKIRRRHDSLNRNYTRASIRAIHCVTQHFIERNSFNHFHIFLIGIGLRVLRTIMNYSYFKIRKVALSGLVLISAIYFTIFYSPVFWHFGNYLLYHDKIDQFKDYKNIVVFSGHGDTSYYNQTYQFRYKDIVSLTSELNEVENIYILGRLQEIPEQRIIQKLLLSDGFDRRKLKIIYEEYQNTKITLKVLVKLLKDEIDKIFYYITLSYQKSKMLWTNKVIWM